MEYFIDNINFIDLVKKLLATSRVLAPVEQYGRNYIQEVKVDNIQSINLSGYRTVEPFKSCFFAIDEVVSEYFDGKTEPKAEQLTIWGRVAGSGSSGGRGPRLWRRGLQGSFLPETAGGFIYYRRRLHRLRQQPVSARWSKGSRGRCSATT